MWEECICSKKELQEWHKLICMMGECVECGVYNLPICPYDVSIEVPYKISSKCFE